MTNAFTASGLFGDLFCDPALAAEFGADAFTQRMLAFEAAWTKALGVQGVVSASAAEAAQNAIEAYSGADLGAGSARDGIPVPALVRALRSGLSDEQARAIHTGATSQDVMDTAMMLTCLQALDMMSERMARIHSALDELLSRFGGNPLMARTRMQAALPATAALRIEAWQRPLSDHMLRAEALRAVLSNVQIGGPIGSRSAPEAHVQACAQSVADDLGLKLGPVWHSDRSRVVDFGHWLTLVSGTLGKMGQDIALMAQQGVGEIVLAGGGGSSAMAHKQNPIAAEALVTLARYVAGQQGVLAQAMIHEQERSGAAWALEWLTLPAMAEATGAALNRGEQLLATVEWIGTSE